MARTTLAAAWLHTHTHTRMPFGERQLWRDSSWSVGVAMIHLRPRTSYPPSDIDDEQDASPKTSAIPLPLPHSMSCSMHNLRFPGMCRGDIIIALSSLLPHPPPPPLSCGAHSGATLLGEEVMAELDLDTDVVLRARAKATSSYRSVLAPGVQPTPSARPIECLRGCMRSALSALYFSYTSPVLSWHTAAMM